MDTPTGSPFRGKNLLKLLAIAMIAAAAATLAQILITGESNSAVTGGVVGAVVAVVLVQNKKTNAGQG